MAGWIEVESFEEGPADALGESTKDLALDDNRVDDDAAIVDEGIAQDADRPSAWVDFDDGGMDPTCECHRALLVMCLDLDLRARRPMTIRARAGSLRSSENGARMLAISAPETTNVAESIRNAVSRPSAAATIPPRAAPTASIVPHSEPNRALAGPRSRGSTRLGNAALEAGSNEAAKEEIIASRR